jgi:diguanylate cyclase (GGDEF)-like protein
MGRIKSSWVVEPSVPKAVRGDYAIVAAQHVRAQEPLLLAGFTFGVPCAMLLGESLPGAIRFGLPTAILALCLLGMIFRPREPTSEDEATRSLTAATCRTGGIIALGTIWSILTWQGAEETVRFGSPFFMALGVIVTGYAFAKVRRLAGACLLIGIVPIATIMLAQGNPVEKACGAAMIVAAIFLFIMASNNRRFLVELLEKRQALHHLSRRDSLTGLPNRRAFLDDAYRIGAHAPHLRLVLLDLDRFKAINDTHGHEMGDRVLCEVSRIIEQFARDGVAVARVGGEEFALVGSIDDLSAVAGLHLLTTLRQADMPHGARVTASIGMASGPLRSDDDWKVLYSLADQALYEAKAEGRDCAVAGATESPDDLGDLPRKQTRDDRAA